MKKVLWKLSESQQSPFDVLYEEVAKSLSQKYPDLTVNLAQNVSVDGVNFRSGMDLLMDCLILAKLCRYVF